MFRLLNPAEWWSASTSAQRMRVAVISKYTQATLIPLLHSSGQLAFFFFFRWTTGLKENAVTRFHFQTAFLYYRATSPTVNPSVIKSFTISNITLNLETKFLSYQCIICLKLKSTDDFIVGFFFCHLRLVNEHAFNNLNKL